MGDDDVVNMPTKLMGRCFYVRCRLQRVFVSEGRSYVFPLCLLARNGSLLSQASCTHRQGRVICTELTGKAGFTFLTSPSP